MFKRLVTDSCTSLQHGHYHLQKFENKLQKIYWDWPAVSEAIRGRPGYIITLSEYKKKEIRRYISTYFTINKYYSLFILTIHVP